MGKLTVDYLVVGSGLTGAVIARTLADAGREVLVLDRRPESGGNVHDHVHPSGIRIHTYGPHYFRTASSEIWDFVNRFGEFYRYEACLKTYVDGRYENWPLAADQLQRLRRGTWRADFQGRPGNFEEACLAMMPRSIYEQFVRGYTEKQWGVAACSLSRQLAGRFDVRQDGDPRLKRHRHQGIPLRGYAALMRNMLQGIPVLLNCDYLRRRHDFAFRKLLVFTGPIDEFYGFELGRLHYRGQQREHDYLPDVEFAMPCGQVNNPDPGNGPHIRTLEWKHMLPAPFADRIQGTVLTREVPFSPRDPDQFEYPFPDHANAELYRRYRERADADETVLICGRLGEYRYFDMDQAIARARLLVGRILGAKFRSREFSQPDA
jgi:UDP-galactopyranose mutase